LLFTIGHSNHAIEHFLGLLGRHAIGAVADVRSRPYSRFVPHFSKERLERSLADTGIGYLFLGQELGGKPPQGDPDRWPADYPSRVQEPAFRSGIDALLGAARRQRVVILCRERDPLDCHRLHLICRYVKPLVDEIEHILPDGQLEAQAVTESRLLARAGAAELPLFGPEGDQLEQAYDRWWQRAR
jgi:uncharacterized protein (DUF488 family)